MATPLKPWERGGSGYRPSAPLGGATSVAGEKKEDGSYSPQRPTVPPRPATTGLNNTNQAYSSYSPNRYYGPSYTTGYNSYGSYMGGYPSSYGYRPFGMYGGGGYGYGGQYGYGSQYGVEDSQMVRQAEERTRDAFQSVESVVGAFASVAMMLESTYVAVHSSFRALLGVAQHFSRLRNHIWGIISAISILRRLRNWLRWLLSVTRMRRYATTDEAWDDASDAFTNAALQNQSSQHLWPLIMFCTVIIGVPWLLWRLLSSVLDSESSPPSEAQQQWSTSATSSQGCTVAKALYSFTAENSNELSVTAGDELVVAPRQFQPNHQGWILVGGRNRKSGLVPVNYIEFLPERSSSQSRPSSATSSTTGQQQLNNSATAEE